MSADLYTTCSELQDLVEKEWIHCFDFFVGNNQGTVFGVGFAFSLTKKIVQNCVVPQQSQSSFSNTVTKDGKNSKIPI